MNEVVTESGRDILEPDSEQDRERNQAAPVYPRPDLEERMFAWGGMSIIIPKGWDPAVLHKDYLRLEDDRRPTLELRWKLPAKGASARETARDYLRRLEKTLGAAPMPDFEKADVSPVANDFETALFSARAGETIYRGAAVFCPRCRRIAVLQVGMPDGDDTVSLPARVISSFRDYHPSDWVPWTLFDIRADVPGVFTLHSHTFQAGYFRMTFKRGSLWLTLHRWAPADVILRNKTLEDWFSGHYTKELKKNGGTLRKRLFKGFPAVEAAPDSGGGPFRRLGRRLIRAGRFQALVWRSTEANRLMGVEREGRDSTDNRLFYEVAERFKVLVES